MTWRQLIIGIIIVSVLFALIMLGLLGVLKYKPELIGIRSGADSTIVEQPIKEIPAEMPKPEPLKFVHIEPTVEISKAQLYLFEWEVHKKNELMVKFDSLKRIEKYLRDSLKSNDNTLRAFKDSLSRAYKNADKAIKNKDDMQDSLSKVNEALKLANNRYETAQKRIENYENMLEARIDTASKINFETFAKIYDNTRPQEVAGILEQLDERDAAKILKLMNKKKAGKVLEAMKPENAAAILLLGVGQ